MALRTESIGTASPAVRRIRVQDDMKDSLNYILYQKPEHVIISVQMHINMCCTENLNP